MNLKKLIISGLIVTSIITIPVFALNYNWINTTQGWRHLESENNFSYGWKFIDEKWYYFDNNGYMKTGWIKDNNDWYYLYNDGSMAANTFVDNYYVGFDGAWIPYYFTSLRAPYQFTSLFENINYSSDLEIAISKAIIDHAKFVFLPGELATEGHITFGTEEKDNQIKAYTLSRFGFFSFQNNIFETVSGCGAIPTVITFGKNANGKYHVIKYEEAEDGETYENTIKKMFPENLYESAISKKSSGYDILKLQQETQAKTYLKKLNRNASVSLNYVEKQHLTINPQAIDALFIYAGKEDEFLNLVPDWIGTKELIENNERIIYETSQNKNEDGYNIVILKKLKSDGTVLQERKYKIINDKAILI